MLSKLIAALRPPAPTPEQATTAQGAAPAPAPAQATPAPAPNAKPAKITALERVQTAPMALKPLFNPSELKTFAAVRCEVHALDPQYRVFGQVALPEIIAAGSRYDRGGAYIAIEGRRIDILVTDRLCAPVLAIEHDGPHHATPKGQARDRIKDEALTRVGLPLLRLAHDTTPGVRDAAIRQAMTNAIQTAAAA